MRDSLKASLVWDGGETMLPPEMGTPRDDQMVGSPRERLVEICGRVCYDSCGSGRPSFSKDGKEGFHEHIRKVGHLSVLEHATATFRLTTAPGANLAWIHSGALGSNIATGMIARLLLNRPGVFGFLMSSATMRVTLNLRAVLEWDAWSATLDLKSHDATQLGLAFRQGFSFLATNIVGGADSEMFVAIPTTPSTPHEEWVSLYVAGSRGMTHELVRHGDFTAISQRSTRYVDESESEWVTHPLLAAAGPSEMTAGNIAYTVAESRHLYRRMVEELQAWAEAKGMDRTTARKQARGAARGYLGNALSTEMIFSASVWQWRNILKQRGSDAADAEIRQLALGDGDPEYPSIIKALKGSRYGDRFKDMTTTPSTTGVGVCLACG